MKFKYTIYKCDDCRKRSDNFSDDKEARAAGWVISHDRQLHYCPCCAPNHKYTGRGGAKQVGVR